MKIYISTIIILLIALDDDIANDQWNNNDVDGDPNSVAENVSMGSDFSDSLTELRAGRNNYFGRSVSCRIYNFHFHK